MAGDQLTHGEAVTAGLTSVAELSSVVWETAGLARLCTRGVGVSPGSCSEASENVLAWVPQP